MISARGWSLSKCKPTSAGFPPISFTCLHLRWPSAELVGLRLNRALPLVTLAQLVSIGPAFPSGERATRYDALDVGQPRSR